MIAKNLISQIRKAKGPIVVAFNNFDDVMYVEVNKKDLLVQLSARFMKDEETGLILDKNNYLDKDYESLIRD
jgi:hypothetical protein